MYLYMYTHSYQLSYTCVANVSALSRMALSCSSWSESSPYWSNARADTVSGRREGVGVGEGRRKRKEEGKRGGR